MAVPWGLMARRSLRGFWAPATSGYTRILRLRASMGLTTHDPSAFEPLSVIPGKNVNTESLVPGTPTVLLLSAHNSQCGLSCSCHNQCLPGHAFGSHKPGPVLGGVDSPPA